MDVCPKQRIRRMWAFKLSDSAPTRRVKSVMRSHDQLREKASKRKCQDIWRFRAIDLPVWGKHPPIQLWRHNWTRRPFQPLIRNLFTRTAKTTVYDQSIRALPRDFLAEIIEDSNGIKKNSGLSELTACCLSSPLIPPRSVDQKVSIFLQGGQPPPCSLEAP